MKHNSLRGPFRACLWLVSLGPILAIAEGRGTVERETVKVPMRDGILLATDIYRAASVEKSPVLLMRTPYNKEGGRAVAERFAAAGYVAVVQDCRGRFASDGEFIPYNNEGQDGFDTIEWLGEQPWSNGRVGMWGASYVGAVQWQAAVERPPGLVAIAPTATFSSFYRNLYLGGAVRLSLITQWAAGNSARPKESTPPTDWSRILLHLPLSNIDREIGWPVPWLIGTLTHPRPDGYWTRLELTDEIVHLDLPAQHLVGYYDFFARESVFNFVRMREHAKTGETRARQQLILGPWDHGTIGKAKVADIDFGPTAVLDSAAENLQWFQRYVKQDPAATPEPLAAVRYFSLGNNIWKTAETWPPPDTQATSFYLHSGGRANTRMGDGRLDLHPPSGPEPADHFRADPADPTPACPATPARPANAPTWGPVDQRPIEDRPDVLVYSSEPFTEPLTFAGNLTAELYVSADTPDADWVAKVIDVHPDGFAQNLAAGILRGRFRSSEMKLAPLMPGETYPMTIDLGPMAAQIGVGHRLRVDISGAYFPLFDRNPNTGEGPIGSQARVATERVLHEPKFPSRLVLPRSL